MVFRQTHAIWTMESPNAVTINSTLNFISGGNTVYEIIGFIVIICIVMMLLSLTVTRAF